MNITSALRTIQEFHMTLSEQDARQCLEAPYEFAEGIAEQLRALGLAAAAAPNGHGRKPKPESHIKLGRGRRATAPNGHARGTRGSKHVAKGQGAFPCPHCGQKFQTQGFLLRHLRQKHGQQPSSAPASVSAAASDSTLD